MGCPMCEKIYADEATGDLRNELYAMQDAIRAIALAISSIRLSTIDLDGQLFGQLTARVEEMDRAIEKFPQ